MVNESGAAGGDDRTTDTDANWSQAAQRHYDPDRDDELAATIVFAVAEARGVPVREVRSPPLYEVIDASALEETFFGAGVTQHARQGTGTVEFRYEEFLVTVNSDGWIQVYESTEADIQ